MTAYANLLSGALDLYEATLQPAHLDFALALAETMLARFYDAKEGGFYDSAADAKDLILRVKEDYDGAEPSGNSTAVLALLRLAAITDLAHGAPVVPYSSKTGKGTEELVNALLGR